MQNFSWLNNLNLLRRCFTPESAGFILRSDYKELDMINLFILLFYFYLMYLVQGFLYALLLMLLCQHLNLDYKVCDGTIPSQNCEFFSSNMTLGTFWPLIFILLYLVTRCNERNLVKGWGNNVIGGISYGTVFWDTLYFTESFWTVTSSIIIVWAIAPLLWLSWANFK